MTFPISRQGLEQLAIVLAVGAAVFAVVALVTWLRHGYWRRFAVSGGFLAALIVVDLGLAYTVAPNIPTPPVPFTARFLQDPTPNDPATKAAGRALYQTNCAVCHGLVGDGVSLVASQMSLRPPPNLHKLRNPGPGHVFQVVTQGFGLMPSYAAELTPQERWAVVAYLGALRRSQAGSLADAPPDIQQKLRAEAGQ